MAGHTNIGQAYVQIMPSAEGIKGSVSKVLDPEAKSAGNSAGASIVSGLTKVFASAAIGQALATSLNMGGALEQSIGGVETLYGDLANDVIANAGKAFQTAGLSANEYMETATTFAAALNSSLKNTEGSIERSAQITDMAIQDMADNSNKMGTSMDSIQAAYAGFAKQQYTLLDNLKLGYGGTKTEMLRLLADAQKITGVKYDLNNLADVYEAIHVIQNELGVTGATAKEASTTLEGSLNAMKASAKNLIADLALGRDVGTDMQNLIQTAITAIGGNVLPMLGNIAASIPPALMAGISTAAPMLSEGLKTGLDGLLAFIGTQLPALLSKGAEIVQNVANGVLTALPSLITTGMGIITQLVSALLANLPQMMSTGVQLIGNLASGILNSLPTIVSTAAQAIASFLAEVARHLPELLQKGIELLGQIGAGIIQAIPTLIGLLPQVFNNIVNAFKAFDWLAIGKDIITGIGDGIKSAVSGLVDAAKNAAGALVDGVKTMFKIGSPSKLMADEVGKWIPAGIAEGIRENMGTVTSAMQDVANAVTFDTSLSGAGYDTTAGNNIGSLQAQITALSGAIENINSTPVPIILDGDAAKLFKVTRAQNQKFKRITGASAF